MKNINILDCTFRDGGYYNLWDFNAILVQKYLLSIDNANIDIIELGFRNFPQDRFLGAFAYTTDHYINSLSIANHISVCVMVDASQILNSGLSINDAVDALFQTKDKSRVDVVRIATHFNLVSQCLKISKRIKELGYQVCLNLMQPNNKSNDELFHVAKFIEGWHLVDILYFADSLGSMEGDDVIRTVSALKQGWSGSLGFHAHNNKGLAVSNTLFAIDDGVEWVDSTILGMGRGAGNTQTENLLLEIEKKYKTSYKADSLFDLVLTEFTPLQQSYHWGDSLLYRLSAMNDIHPSYVQEMLADNSYSNKELLQSLEFMSSIDASHYKEDMILAPSGDMTNNGSWSAKNWCLNKEILLLGSGPSVKYYLQEIIQYVKKYNPVVVSLNIKDVFPHDLIDVYVSSNESKISGEYLLYERLDKPLAISAALLKKIAGKNIRIKELWDYGLNIEKGVFNVCDKECTLPYELSLGYALSLANAGCANSISLVGFDGYNNNDTRHARVSKLIDMYDCQSLITVTSLTPSTYNFLQGSIFAKKQ